MSPNQQGHSDTFASSGQIQQVWSTPGGANVSSGYNTYGFQYIPGTGMRFYFNGTQVYSSSADLSTQSYYLFLQLQVASSGTSGWHTIGELHARLHADRRGPGLLIVAVPVGQHRGGDRPTDQLPELAGGGSPPLALGAGT